MIEDQLKDLHTIRLSEDVKTRMRSELVAYAELHVSPVSVLPAVTASSMIRGFNFRLYAGFAIALLLIVSITGTAYASESSLPGDILYSLKVNVTEPIQTALVPSERGKAAWDAILAERRLDEAAQLAAQNKLTPDAQTELAANFTAHVTASEIHATHLERSGDTTGSLSAQSDLEARLTAHEQILQVIAAHYAIASSTNTVATKDSLSTLLALVRTHENDIVSSRVALEDAIAPHSGDTSARTTASTTSATEVAIAAPGPIHFHHQISPAARVAGENAARTEEVTAILDHHAAMLAKFLPLPVEATTTATSTTKISTTTPVTASTTAPVLEKSVK